MKKFIKIIAMMMAMLMLVATFAACNNTSDDNTDDSNDNVAQSTTGGEQTVADLEVINWNGTDYRILGKESSTWWAQSFEVWREEMPEDVVGKAVWDRNQTMYDKYGINVVGFLVSNATSSATTMLNSGEDLYDLMLLPPEQHHPLAMQGYLLDMYKLDHVNMEHDGWMPYPNKQLTMGGKLFYTTNKFMIQDKARSWCVFYNRDHAQELKVGYVEELVFKGEWTVDKALEFAKIATYESDGQSGMTLGDNWGFGAAEFYEFGSLAYGAGFRLTEHGTDGYPKIIGATDQMIKYLDKAYSLRSSDYFFLDMDYGNVNWDDCTNQAFQAGRILFLACPLSAHSGHQEKSNFVVGVLPNPKYDEDQELYHTIPNLLNGSLLSVPATVLDPSFAGYALQAITEESVDTSYPAFIEQRAQLQNAHDEDAAKCIAMIFDGVVYDIAFISDIGGLGQLVRSTLGSTKNNTYSRLYGRMEKMANKEMNDIRETYAALD